MQHIILRITKSVMPLCSKLTGFMSLHTQLETDTLGLDFINILGGLSDTPILSSAVLYTPMHTALVLFIGNVMETVHLHVVLRCL